MNFAVGLIAIILLAATITFFAVAGTGKYDPRDLQRACAHHDGVAEIVDKAWSPGSEKALVLCRDGRVKGIAR